MTNTVAAIFGGLYCLIGVVGFLLTPSGEAFLGIFAANWFHHVFHIVAGGLGPVAAWLHKSRLYCQITGGVFILLGVLGLIAPRLVATLLAHPTADLFTDNLLHLMTGIALSYFGFLSRSTSLASGNQTGKQPVENR
jgi:hypothetical protein